MAYYRLYFLNGDSSHILECLEFEARDDEAAVTACESRQAFGPMELWCRDRRVRSWLGRPRSEGAPPAR